MNTGKYLLGAFQASGPIGARWLNSGDARLKQRRRRNDRRRFKFCALKASVQTTQHAHVTARGHTAALDVWVCVFVCGCVHACGILTGRLVEGKMSYIYKNLIKTIHDKNLYQFIEYLSVALYMSLYLCAVV